MSGLPTAEHGVFDGFADPWGSGEQTDSGPAETASREEAPLVKAATPACVPKDTGLAHRVRQTEELVLQRWSTLREREDELLRFSSMIACMPLPAGHCCELPRGYNGTWDLEVRREAGRWRVLAGDRGFQPGEVVERCALLPLKRPEDDDEAICRLVSLWDPDEVWTKEHGRKLPELRAQKLQELELLRTEVLHHHRMVRTDAFLRCYPLGYAHLYADAEQAPAAEIRVERPQPNEVAIVALREILPGEEVTLSKRAPVMPRARPGATAATAAPPSRPQEQACGGAVLCSGHITTGPSGLHGRGVFLAPGAAYAKGRVVELSPALVLDGPAAVHCADYAMAFGGNCGTCAVLPLGCGSLYNHVAAGSGRSPLAWAYDEELELVVFRTDAAVADGCELVVDYGGGYWDSRGVEPAAA